MFTGVMKWSMMTAVISDLKATKVVVIAYERFRSVDAATKIYPSGICNL